MIWKIQTHSTKRVSVPAMLNGVAIGTSFVSPFSRTSAASVAA